MTAHPSESSMSPTPIPDEHAENAADVPPIVEKDPLNTAVLVPSVEEASLKAADISTVSAAHTTTEVRQGCIPAMFAGLWGGEARLAALASGLRQPILSEKGEEMRVTTLEHWPTDVEVGELFVTVVVRAANVVSDLRENIRNLVGGRMTHYEGMIQRAVQEAIDETKRKAKEAGYDGVMGLKIAHPSVVDGGVELIIYANGFRFLSSQKQSTENTEKTE